MDLVLNRSVDRQQRFQLAILNVFALQRGTADGTISALAVLDGYKLQNLLKQLAPMGRLAHLLNVTVSSRKPSGHEEYNLKKVFVTAVRRSQLQAALNLDNAGSLSKRFASWCLICCFFPEQLPN